MAAEASFQDLIRRVRAGDPDAAAEVVRRYEPEVRRVIRLQLLDGRLRRVFDSSDVCQSVLANFFVRVAGGQFELEHPGQLVRLLVTMAQNKLVDYARKPWFRAAAANDPGPLETVEGREERPSEVVARRELLEEARRRLTDEERALVDRRASGRGWAEIAAECHDSPEALRKKLARAIDRVCLELGLDLVNHA
jgi:RNA polymerase sigma-70 factor (ECF subfamily)